MFRSNIWTYRWEWVCKKVSTWKLILEVFWKKLSYWGNKCENLKGKIILINFVIISISKFYLPFTIMFKSFRKEVVRIKREFMSNDQLKKKIDKLSEVVNVCHTLFFQSIHSWKLLYHCPMIHALVSQKSSFDQLSVRSKFKNMS